MQRTPPALHESQFVVRPLRMHYTARSISSHDYKACVYTCTRSLCYLVRDRVGWKAAGGCDLRDMKCGHAPSCCSSVTSTVPSTLCVSSTAAIFLFSQLPCQTVHCALVTFLICQMHILHDSAHERPLCPPGCRRAFINEVELDASQASNAERLAACIR